MEKRLPAAYYEALEYLGRPLSAHPFQLGNTLSGKLYDNHDVAASHVDVLVDTLQAFGRTTMSDDDLTEVLLVAKHINAATLQRTSGIRSDIAHTIIVHTPLNSPDNVYMHCDAATRSRRLAMHHYAASVVLPAFAPEGNKNKSARGMHIEAKFVRNPNAIHGLFRVKGRTRSDTIDEHYLSEYGTSINQFFSESNNASAAWMFDRSNLHMGAAIDAKPAMVFQDTYEGNGHILTVRAEAGNTVKNLTPDMKIYAALMEALKTITERGWELQLRIPDPPGQRILDGYAAISTGKVHHTLVTRVYDGVGASMDYVPRAMYSSVPIPLADVLLLAYGTEASAELRRRLPEHRDQHTNIFFVLSPRLPISNRQPKSIAASPDAPAPWPVRWPRSEDGP